MGADVVEMLRMLTCVIAVAALGCTGSYCEEPHVVATSSSEQPGALRTALALRTYATGVSTQSDGSMLCLTCAGLARFDGQLHEARGLEDAVAVVVAPDDTIYAAVGGPSAPSALVALSPTGAERWRAPLGEVSPPTKLIATASKVYMQLAVAGETIVASFDAGSSQYGELTAQALIAAGGDSIFTVDTRRFTSELTLRRLGSTGNLLWERTWRTVQPQLVVYDAVATADGGVIIVGHAGSTIDFGDRSLDTSSRLLNFVVGIDPTGATLWAFSLPVFSTSRMALTPAGEILLAGRVYTGEPDDGMDAFLALATPAGLVRMHVIGGRGDQDVEDLTASPDGLAWLQVANASGAGVPDPVLRVAEHAFHDAGSYLLKLVP